MVVRSSPLSFFKDYSKSWHNHSSKEREKQSFNCVPIKKNHPPDEAGFEFLIVTPLIS